MIVHCTAKEEIYFGQDKNMIPHLLFCKNEQADTLADLGLTLLVPSKWPKGSKAPQTDNV